MVMPPKTKAVPSNEEMYAYYELAAIAAKEAGVTIMPYNNPDAAGYHAISTELLRRLAALPEVTALKISTTDVSTIETLDVREQRFKNLGRC